MDFQADTKTAEPLQKTCGPVNLLLQPDLENVGLDGLHQHGLAVVGLRPA